MKIHSQQQFNWSILGCLGDVWVIIDRLKAKRWREYWKLDQLPIYFHQHLSGSHQYLNVAQAQTLFKTDQLFDLS